MVINLLNKIEAERGIALPDVYKEFYSRCYWCKPTKLVGTDLVNKHSDLKELAEELLKENNIECFLEPQDFVFMMHQGYVFCYFKADGTPDPIVYRFIETETEPEQMGPFSEFVEEYF